MANTRTIRAAPTVGNRIMGSVAAPEDIATRPAENVWGWLPVLSVVASCGLLLVALADAASIRGLIWAEPLFYTGLVVLLAPTGIRLATKAPSRQERIGLVLILGMSLYLVKIMHSPLGFTFSDEFVHWHNVNQILQNHALFQWNSILQATPYYPGLEILTSALVMLSGLSVYQAGIIVIAVARLILFLSLFLFAEQVSRSARVAGIATMLFMCHPFFLFWSAQFSYESLSLPMIITVLFLTVRRETVIRRDVQQAFTMVAFITIAAVVITHHLSVYFLAVFLIGWTVVARARLGERLAGVIEGLILRFRGRLPREVSQPYPVDGATSVMRQRVAPRAAFHSGAGEHNHDTGSRGPADLALVTTLATVIWLFLVANLTINYLRPVITNAVISLLRLITQEESSRVFFVTATGYVPPLWERLTQVGSVLLSLLALPLGLYQVVRRLRNHALILTLGLLAIAYFGLLSFRLTSAAWETATRGTAYTFIGLSFVLALGIAETTLSGRFLRAGHLLFPVFITVLFVGGFLSGWQPNIRLARPYMIAAGDQLIMPAGYSVAEWSRDELGSGHRFAADISNGGALLAVGGQVSFVSKDPNADVLVNTPDFGQYQLGVIQDHAIRYILMDQRLISRDGMAGRYFDRLQGGGLTNVGTLEPDLIDKYDGLRNVSRIMDGGTIVVYDLEALLNGPVTP